MLPGSAYPWRFFITYAIIVMPPMAAVTVGDIFFLMVPMVQDVSFYGNVVDDLTHRLRELKKEIDFKVNRYVNDKSLGIDLSPQLVKLRAELTNLLIVCKELDKFIRACGSYFLMGTFGMAPTEIIALFFTATEESPALRLMVGMIFFMATAIFVAFAIHAASVRRKVSNAQCKLTILL